MAKIRARRRWNETPYHLQEGKSYLFSASGTWHDGLAWKVRPTGYSNFLLKPFERWRRKPKAKWFSLIGAIDRRTSSQFDIGRLIEEGETYRPGASGQLFCFANDLWLMYWNNFGAVDLEVEEVPEGA